MEYVTWQPLLGLLSWNPLIFVQPLQFTLRLGTVDIGISLQMSYSDLTGRVAVKHFQQGIMPPRTDTLLC